MKAHAKATPSESTPRRAIRLAILLTLAFLLVPAAQASANEILEVDIEGSGAGEVIPVLEGEFEGIPPINCAYASPGPATGQCEVQMSNEGGFEAVYMKAVPAPGSEFVEWKIEEGTAELCNESFPAYPNGEACLPSSEANGGAKLTAVFKDKNEILKVDIEGAGSGEVIPVLEGEFEGIPPINCTYASPGPATGQCEVQMSNEGGFEAVYMKAVPAPDSEFVEWKIEEGTYFSCNESFPAYPNGEACLPYSEANGGAKLTAVFKESVPHYDVALDKAGTGEGDLTIECEEGSGFVPCTSPIEEGMEVKVSASAKAGSVLSALSGTGGAQGNCAIETSVLGSCTFTITEDSSVSASFATSKLTVTKLSNGNGTVTSSPEGIKCGTVSVTCKANFPPGTVVTLTATPDTGSKLKGWSGCDNVVGNQCTVTMSANRALSATFTTKPKIEEQSAHPHDTTATLRATINPNGEETTYQFEYLSEAQYQANGEDFTGAIKVPAAPASIGEGNKGVPVAHPIGGLTPQSTYRYRLQTTNAVDSVEAQGAFTTYPSDPSFGACPQNEASRLNLPSAALPDCRAYEQATPIDKNSGNVQSGIDSLKASANGDRVAFESVASFPGAEGAQTFGTYLSSRGAEDWSTQGLLLPGSLTSGSGVTGWTPDLAQVFDTASRDTGEGYEAALFSRSSVDGSLTMVAPYTLGALYYFRSASTDGSKALFSAYGKLTEDAAQDKSNLYAWDRETGDLHLAGVLPDGATPPGGSETANNGYPQDLRTVATGGSAYFRAGSPEQIYLRQNPTAPETTVKDGEGNCVPDPAHACTLHVSASEKTVPDPGGPLQATFQHASTEGSVAYFTSSEELTDDAHTIAPPHAISSANLDGSIANSLLLPGANAAAVAIDGSHIYWVDRAAGTIGRAELDGQNPEPSCIAGGDHPQGIAVGVGSDSNHLYWTNAKDGEAGTGTIGRADIGGSCAAAQSSANQSFVTGATDPRGMDTDGSYLYWGNGKLPSVPSCAVSPTGSCSVGRAEVSGAGVNQVFVNAGEVTDVAVDPAHNHLYIARGWGGAIARTNLDDGTGNVFLPSSGAAQQIALDANRLYWTIATSEAGATTNIGRSDLDGTNKDTNFIAAQSPSGIALDGSHIYWGTHPTGRGTDLYRFDAEAPVGDRLTDVMPVPTALTGAEVQGVLGTSEDGSYVYFAANGIPAGVANSPNANGESPVSGSCKGSPDGTVPTASGICNLYLAHAGQITFIARLEAGGVGRQGDGFNWKFGRGAGALRTSRVSADGRTLLFRSRRQLTAYVNKSPQCEDPNHCLEFYRYHAGDPGPTCISCNPTGAPPSGRQPTLGNMTTAFFGNFSPVGLLSRSLSADGNRVFFETNDALLAADTNGDESCGPWGSANQAASIRTCQDVYEWEAKGTGTCESEAQNGGCLYLLSTGKSKDPSFFVDASTEGDDAFVLTSSQLVRRDKDTLLDIFDARIGGGLAKQNAIPPVPCEGEACKAGASIPVQAPTPATQNFTAPGNPKAVHKKARKARKHKKRRKKQRHAKGQRRAAKTTGRASR